MGAVEEYLKWYADLVGEYYDYDSDHVGGIVANGLVERDARIADLETELKRLLDSRDGAYFVRLADALQRAERAELKCCGNCFHSSSTICCEPQLLETDGDNYVETNGGRNACHFTPSRWQERESASIAVTPTPLSGVAP